MFYKKVVLKNFCNIRRKTPVLESLFKKVSRLKACNFLKKRLQHGCFCEYWEISKNTYFEEHVQTAASVNTTTSKRKVILSFHVTAPLTH